MVVLCFYWLIWLKCTYVVTLRAGQRQEYIYGYLEEIVSATKSPRLSLTVLSENKRILKIPKVFSSDHIEYLHISAPCTFRSGLPMLVIIIPFVLYCLVCCSR